MTKYDFEINYATKVEDNYGTVLMINPLHTSDTGSMWIQYKNGVQLGGEYKLREDGSNLYFTSGKFEYLLRPTEEGFDLLVGETEKYSFRRIP